MACISVEHQSKCVTEAGSLTMIELVNGTRSAVSVLRIYAYQFEGVVRALVMGISNGSCGSRVSKFVPRSFKVGEGKIN